MVPLGLNAAGAVRVGHAVGRRDRDGVWRSGWTALALGAVTASSAVVFLAAGRPLIAAFSRDAAVLAIGPPLLVIASSACIFDGTQGISTGILRGLGDTRTPMIANLAGHWLVGLPLAYAACFWWGWGVQGLWMRPLPGGRVETRAGARPPGEPPVPPSPALRGAAESPRGPWRSQRHPGPCPHPAPVFSSRASGEQFQVLVDTNANPGSGCAVPTVDGSFEGVEKILTTRFSGGLVTGVTLQSCIGPATGASGPPTLVSPGGWPVAIGGGPNGVDAVETFVPIPALGVSGGRVRRGFASRDANDIAVDAVIQGGQGYVFWLARAIPTLSLVGVLLLSALLALAAWRRYPHSMTAEFVLVYVAPH